ncbi:MAG TPA: ribosome small subunit-dependent GTPase A [Gaiellaceae bacterium]|nr:ribosome small subunit-dependent GTPase A [Gaiellaceae bacterium]
MTPSVSASPLQRLGWDEAWAAAFAEHADAGLTPARIAAQHRGAYDLIHESGGLRAAAAARLARDGDLPSVGDWVALDLERALVDAVLPRRTAISRKEVWQAAREQVLAANVDVAFLVQSLPHDFNPRRLERYLAMAWESGAQPVVVLTKTDLVDDVDGWVAEAESLTLGACPVVALSAVTGDHLDDVIRFLDGNRTGVLLGSSGVGKSTLVNALAGTEVLATQEVRAGDDRGRHTTTHRQLLVLPGGGVVLDTPGLRELQLWDADLGQTFGDVEEVAARCRFADCRHAREPGCAVREALADGSLAADRWQSYVKLQRELAALELRRNHLLRQERVREFKIRERASRPRKRR